MELLQPRSDLPQLGHQRRGITAPRRRGTRAPSRADHAARLGHPGARLAHRGRVDERAGSRGGRPAGFSGIAGCAEHEPALVRGEGHEPGERHRPGAGLDIHPRGVLLAAPAREVAHGRVGVVGRERGLGQRRRGRAEPGQHQPGPQPRLPRADVGDALRPPYVGMVAFPLGSGHRGERDRSSQRLGLGPPRPRTQPSAGHRPRGTLTGVHRRAGTPRREAPRNPGTP